MRFDSLKFVFYSHRLKEERSNTDFFLINKAILIAEKKNQPIYFYSQQIVIYGLPFIHCPKKATNFCGSSSFRNGAFYK